MLLNFNFKITLTNHKNTLKWARQRHTNSCVTAAELWWHAMLQMTWPTAGPASAASAALGPLRPDHWTICAAAIGCNISLCYVEREPTLSMRDSSMLLEYSFSLNSSRSMRELSMSAERWGMFETQATVRSLAGVGGLRVDGDWEPWGREWAANGEDICVVVEKYGCEHWQTHPRFRKWTKKTPSMPAFPWTSEEKEFKRKILW